MGGNSEGEIVDSVFQEERAVFLKGVNAAKEMF